jgi:hypothetical protein
MTMNSNEILQDALKHDLKYTWFCQMHCFYFFMDVVKGDKKLIALTPIDLVIIDQHSVGKRSLHLMDTVNAKKGWTTI